MHRWHAHGGSSEETPQVGPRCTEGMRMEEVVRRLLKFGPGAQMAKMDKKRAYWMVPVHPQDRPPLGVQWEGTVYFNALADGRRWIAREHGVERCITRGTENPDECRLNLQRLLDLCNHLGYQYHRRRWRGRPVFWAYSLTQSKVNFGSRGVSW